MFRSFLIAAAAAVLVQAFPGRASADVIQYESLDLAVINSDLVVRAEVIEIASKKADDGFVWNQVTIRVNETIKGKKFKEVKFLVQTVQEITVETPGTPWLNRRDELLLCLNPAGSNRGGFEKADFVLHHNNFSWAVLLNGKPRNSLPIYSLDFKALTDPKEILAAARGAAEDRASKPGAKLLWGVPRRDEFRPHDVIFPDSERVRAAAKKHSVELGPN
jgi:hypothetical protein